MLTWEMNPVCCVDCCHTAIRQCLIWVLQYLLERALYCPAVMALDSLFHYPVISQTRPLLSIGSCEDPLGFDKNNVWILGLALCESKIRDLKKLG